MPDNKLTILPREDGEFRSFSIRIREELAEQIDSLAIKSRRTRNEIMSMLMEYAIKNAVVINNTIEDKLP